MSTQSLYVGNNPQVHILMVFGDGAFGKEGLDEVPRVGLPQWHSLSEEEERSELTCLVCFNM